MAFLLLVSRVGMAARCVLWLLGVWCNRIMCTSASGLRGVVSSLMAPLSSWHRPSNHPTAPSPKRSAQPLIP